MTRAELRRRDVCLDVAAGRLTQVQGAVRLGVSDRQMRRLLRRFEADGDRGLMSRRRGKPSNRRLAADTVEAALVLVAQRYADFGPSFANEMLRERHGILISTESLRQAMIRHDLWTPKPPRRNATHRPRERRAAFGELIQIDGSPHDYFEGRAPRCTLLVFIDDATSALVGLRLVKSESTATYMALLRRYLERYGRPQTMYSDRHTIFRVPKSSGITSGLTQLGRALMQLDIEHVCATSPQAKGRVERVNRTLQQRLPKLLRLAQINDIDSANEFLDGYLDQHNERFAHAPSRKEDAHRSLGDINLDDVLTIHHQRFLTKDATFQFNSAVYVLDPAPRYFHPQHLTIIEQPAGTFGVEMRGRPLAYRKLRDVTQAPIKDRKQIADAPDRRQPNPKKAHTPDPTHPWKRYQRRHLDRTLLLGADRT